MKERSLLLGKIHGVGVWTEWKWLGIGSMKGPKPNRCATRCSMSSPTDCLYAPPPSPSTHTHTLNCGSQYNLSSSVCVTRGTMAMQNEFVPVAFCVLRTLERCITVTVLMFTQFCALTAAYHTHPTPPRFLFCSNKLFVTSAVHRSYLAWILCKWCSKLCYELTENTLYCITKTNRLVLFRGKLLFMMWIIQMPNNNVCAKCEVFEVGGLCVVSIVS